MNPATAAGNRVKQAMQRLMRCSKPAATPRSKPPVEGSVVFAVSNCHPTRVAIYAAAFQGGWKVVFMRSLSEVLEAAHTRRPRAVLYDHREGGPSWDHYCSNLAGEGVPFILLAHSHCDQAFMLLLTAGGYPACGSPLTSEDIVKAVHLAEEVAVLSRCSVSS